MPTVIRDETLPEGGFAQYLGGPADLSVSYLSYLALKVAGDDADAPHMRRTREMILRQGGIGFEVTGQYDASRALVVDPVLGFSSYLGGSGTDSDATWLSGINDPYASTCTGSSSETDARPLRNPASSLRACSIAHPSACSLRPRGPSGHWHPSATLPGC